ncbi:MAG: cohesin domain-containing protein [Planctomycetota bacterium]|jgi:hypothetical protein
MRGKRVREVMASLAALIALATPAFAAFEISLSPPTVTVEEGQKFAVTFNVTDCPPFQTAIWCVEFDDTKLQHPDPLTGQLLGDLNPMATGNGLIPDEVINNEAAPGSLRFIGLNPGGDGTLGVIIFTATNAGTATITTYSYPDRANGNQVYDGTSYFEPAVNPLAAEVIVTINPSTPVVMSDSSARSVGVGAVVEWTTASETDNVGFDVLRRRGSGGEWRRVTERAIQGRLTAAGPASYTYLDLAEPGRYEYLVETISTSGARERHGDRETMTVTVRPGDLLGALEELPSLLDACAEEVLEDARAGAVAAHRRRQLAGRRGRQRAALSKSNRRAERPPSVKVLASTSEMSGARHGRSRSIPPPVGPPGGTAIRTRGDGVFFVPAGSLPVAPERAALVAGGARSYPLRCDAAGVWLFAPQYQDSYTDVNTTFVTASAPRWRRWWGRPRWNARRLFRRGAALAPSTKAARRSDVSSSVAGTARAEEDAIYVLGAKDSPDPWFYPCYVNNRSPEQTVSVHVPDCLGGATTLRLAVYGYTYDSRVDPDHELIVSVNGEAVADLTWDGRGYRVFEVALDEGAVRDGENIVGLIAPESPAIPRGHGLVLDYIEVDYARRLSLSHGPLALEVDKTCVLEIPDLPERNLWVVEVDAEGRGSPAAVSFERTRGLYAARFRARRGFAYHVATSEQTRSPDSVDVARAGRVGAGTEYLAIGPERFRGATGPLLELRRREGLSCAYVSLEGAIDTYGWGRYGAGAIVNLVRAVGPRYVLLVGTIPTTT